MKLNVFLIGCIFSITGCITVKAPENLVSDSVKAGKDLYDAVKSDSDKKAQIYKYSYKAISTETHHESNAKCIDGAVALAKKALNRDKIDIKKTESKVSKEAGVKIFKCSVRV
ncbi:hypothetical protein [Catenovulum agarivorans]|uniref:hypothetical protein n=1 Tax=Catenovulum agarivorans TaxID=1172192 RepID=UPI00030437B1|nr:hypothetical protein [Catenovulum agarivorans]